MSTSARRPGARLSGLGSALALAVLAGGCSLLEQLSLKQVSPSHIEQSPTFSAAAVAEQGVVIGAVACSRPERLSSETSSKQLASALRASLLQERPEMKVLMPDSVEQALGAEAYSDWEQYFQDTGIPREELLPEISSKLRDSARYVLVARIEEDEISRTHGDHQVSRTDGKFETDGEEYVTARTTEMLFRLYDLETSTMEWKGHFETTNGNTNVEEDEELVFEILDVVFDEEEESPYPESATIEFQTGQIFEAFAAKVFD